MSASDMSDEQRLLDVFVTAGDHEAFAQLVESHARWLFAAAYRQLKHRQSAEDAVQVVFLLLARQAAMMTDRERLDGWLFRAMRYTVKDMRRSEQARQRREKRFASDAMHSASTAAVRVEEIAEELDAAVAKLPERYREAILLRFYREWSFDQVAHGLGVTEAGARKRVERGLVMLRRSMGVGMTAPVLSACAAYGSDHMPAGLTSMAARTAAGAKTSGAVGANLSATAKGAGMMMMATKTKIAAAAMVAALMVPAALLGVHLAHSTAAPVRVAATSMSAGSGLFVVSNETTDITTPLHADGTPDYVAAINERYGKGVTPENNAFRAWSEVIGNQAGPEVQDTKRREAELQMAQISGAKIIGSERRWMDYGTFLVGKGYAPNSPAFDRAWSSQAFARNQFWTEKEFPEMAEHLKMEEEFLNAMGVVWARRQFWMPAVSGDGRSLFGVVEASPAQLAQMSNSLEARAMLRLGKGNFDGFLADVITIKRMARLHDGHGGGDDRTSGQ